MADHQAVATAVLPLVADAIGAYRTALADAAPGLPDDIEGFRAAWEAWQASSGAGELRAVLRTVEGLLAEVDEPAGLPR